MADDISLLGVFEDRVATNLQDELEDTTGFVDAGKLPRRPGNQKMQVDYTASRAPLSRDEQRLFEKCGQPKSEAALGGPVRTDSRRAPGVVARKKARRTVDELIAEEQASLKPSFLQHQQSISAISEHQSIPPPKPHSASPTALANHSIKRKLDPEQVNATKRLKARPSLGPSASSGLAQQAASIPLPLPLSQLHHEIVAFAEEARPSRAEKMLVEQVTATVRTAASQLWPASSTEKFGSQATQLSMPGSDVDVVILGTETEISLDIYERTEKEICMNLLQSLRTQLGKTGVLDRSYPVNLISARVPIIKCKIRPIGSQHSLRADISIGLGSTTAVPAATLMTNYVHSLPPLRPLVLITKRLLKEQNLHEVSSGGLSSYSLINLVVAHLQAEGYVMSAGGGLSSKGVADFGNLLWGFFMRFGDIFDYSDQAVSINQGGVIKKRPSWRVKFKSWLLAIENPLEPGKEIAGGSYRIREVKATFLHAGMALDKAVHEAKTKTESEDQAWAAIQREGQHASPTMQSCKFPLLSSIINADEALS